MSVENAAVLANETELVNNNSGALTEAEQASASAAAAQTAKDGDDEHDQHSKEGGYQRIKRQRDEARAREEYWRDRAQSGAAPKAQPAPVATEVEEPEPKSTDFSTIDEYLTAVRAWDKKQIVKEVRADLSKTEQQRASEKQNKTIIDTHLQREKDFAAANPEYTQKVSTSTAPISPAMNHVMVRSEVGPAIALYLADNEAESARISKLSPEDAFREMGKLEAKIEASLAQEKPATEEAEVKPAPLKTAAPAPPTPVRKTSSAPAEPDLNKVPYKEFVKIREAQQKKG